MFRLRQLQDEMNEECADILRFWSVRSPDIKNGGFIGKMDNNGYVDNQACKGLVLNARILWTFATAYEKSNDPTYEAISNRAYETISTNFCDREHGGYFWSLNYLNKPLNTRKQIYGQAFVLYALTSFYRCNKKEEVLNQSIDLFKLIEEHASDPDHGGYTEALSSDWSQVQDFRLSTKDLNVPKTLNTHLHILEAYVHLFNIWNDDTLRSKIEDLIDLFLKYFVDMKFGHVHMFFEEDWKNIDSPWSFGHDIETSWLLVEAAESMSYRTEEVKKAALKLADEVLSVLNTNGGVPYESHLNQQHWWVQAEAMVGFFNAFQMTNNNVYLSTVYKIWDYIKKYIKDDEGGEWYWGRYEDGSVMNSEDKIGFWKCPYHNVRSCVQLEERIEKIYIQV